ncbi:trimeric intracellular cation channel family protein [Nocardia jiangxiensis]|uniref:Trimeric intracellular cation channel family protein n=1 Tax=Nocardia jiangxiensis TaxID=282685 RepID=A0ABW6SB69_9NOCA|nr:trimeric intracellular cation channel family protein [Nocardia jiangxiensis]
MIALTSTAEDVQRAADLLGVFAFGVSGALLAVRKDYDMVGIAVLACATAFGGGVVRDVVIGAVPPVALTDPWYLGLPILAAAIIFLWRPPPRLVATPLDLADAVGLGVFSVTGTVAAYQHGLATVPAALLGVLTAVGGGLIRDVLAGVQPSVLRPDQEIYALPALLGASVAAALLHFGALTAWTGAAASAGAVVFRVLALRYHWHAPRARRRRG